MNKTLSLAAVLALAAGLAAAQDAEKPNREVRADNSTHKEQIRGMSAQERAQMVKIKSDAAKSKTEKDAAMKQVHSDFKAKKDAVRAQMKADRKSKRADVREERKAARP
jgi:hypothetical protein